MTLRPFGSRARLNLLIILLSAMSTGLATPVQAQASPQASPTTSPYEYQLVNLWESLPPGMLFFDSAGITNDGRVYGTGYRCDDTGCFPSVIVYRSGRQTVLHDGIAYAVNAFGVVGGSLLLDQTTGTQQAAIFTGTHARIIPRLPGEATSQVIGLTDRGTALVVSVNQTFTPQYYLYDARKRVTSIDFGMGTVSSLKINNGNIIAGTISTPGLPDRAFRFNTMSKAMKILDPINGDPESWGQGINGRGDVLGYSFTFGGLERVGVWRDQYFRTYFVEGTLEFPTVSNKLLWNEAGTIVITDGAVDINGHTDLNSYLVPKPNVRINLSDLVEGLQPWTLVKGINAGGDLIGSTGAIADDVEFDFLLKRVHSHGS